MIEHDERQVSELNGRRRFLTKGALAAAAAAAGVVAISDQAQAADGQALLIGRDNQGTDGRSSVTTLKDSVLRVATVYRDHAITGQNLNGDGVYGESDSTIVGGVGVHGFTPYGGGSGVYGENAGSPGGHGVRGTSAFGVGVAGVGGWAGGFGVGLQGAAPTGASLLLDGTSLTIPPAGTWPQGSFVVIDGHVWYCYRTGSGSAARWVKLSGAPVILPSTYRSYDSRPGEAPLTVQKGKITNGEQRTNIDLTVASGGQVPTGISAVIVNLTATQTDAAGFFALYKNGTAWPGTSTINWGAVDTSVANTTVVAVDAATKVTVRGAGSAHCIMDVIGFLP
ncbi:MAG: hypothetical protein R2726_15595 [Acidimicrobiales bacterium]